MLRRVPALARSTPLLSLCVLACTSSKGDEDTASDSVDSVSDSDTTGDTDTGSSEGWQISVQAGQDLGALMSVWGPGPEDVYAVGGQPDPDPKATILHFDGSDWSEESTPAGTPMLNWVFGSEGRTWAVGQGGTIVTREDDGSWSAETSPSDRVLWG
ncbi:MAG: hypothetical protein KC431_17045, partial [Myxococcales bacterium]|nr:hypothetical protein [Myxococcales bacterium]